MKQNYKKLFGVGLFIAFIGVLAAVYFNFREKPIEGSKAISIEVIDQNNKSTTYELTTNVQFLQQAMDEAEGLTYDGKEGPYGFEISAINGVTADYTKDQAYWGFFVNGEYCNYGISQQPVNDQDAFQIIYTKAN